MADIKVRKKENTAIKKLNRASMMGNKVKSNIVNVKDKMKETYETKEDSSKEYAENKIKNAISKTSNYGIMKANQIGKNNVKITADNIENIKRNIQDKKLKIKDVKESIKRVRKSGSKTAKTIRKSIKSANKNIKTTKTAIRTAEKTTNATVKATKQVAQKTVQVAKETAKTVVKTVQVSIKTLIAIIKGIIATTQAIVSSIIAGGWIAIIIIIIITLIALICSSIFGIFFSNENGIGDKTMSSVVAEINMEFNNKLVEIQNTNPHDDYEINSDRAKWKDIISIYAVATTEGKEQADVVTLDDKKIQKLKDIFWEMNIINFHVEDVEKDIEIINDDGTTTMEKQIRKTLYIDITNVSVEEMINRYGFNKKQREQLAEISKKEYDSLWSKVLYGSTTGSNDIVEVARSQLGNVGGQPYWSWYGFSSRVSWCACFVSWCANQCGYIQAGIIPKFAGCQLEGVNWFKACGLWQERRIFS